VLMLFDKNISPGRNQACASCHMPYVAFSGPIPSVNLTMSPIPERSIIGPASGRRKRHTYSPFFPVLQYNEEQGLFFGGNFWDSRATGYLLRNPTPNRHRVLPLILKKWASLTLLASRFGSRRLCTDRSSKSYGAKPRSISSSQRILRRSAQPQEGLRCSAGTSNQSS